MKPSELRRAVTHLIDIKRPFFIWGPPGIGKSDSVRQVCASLNLELRDRRMSQCDPTDIKGFPAPDLKKGVMRWLPDNLLPTPQDPPGLLFLDELNSAPPAVQAACYQLILDRRCGDYVLPDHWAIGAAGNNEGDRGVVHRMPRPLANRFVHLHAEVDIDEFLQYGEAHGMPAEQIAFHRFRSALVHHVDPNSTDHAFPTPRSWMFVKEIREGKKLSARLERELVKGTIGEGPATEFYSFLELIREMPDLEKIYTSPDTVPVPTTPAVMYAVVTEIEMRTKTVAQFEQYMRYITRLPKEFQVIYVRNAYHNIPEIGTASAVATQWFYSNTEIFMPSV